VVIMVLSSVEDAMNAIWHTRRGRSLFRKIMDYLALLVLLPISVNIALAGDAILESPKIMEYITTFIPSAWVVQMLLKLLPFIFITLSLMMMYLFFPMLRLKRQRPFAGPCSARFSGSLSSVPMWSSRSAWPTIMPFMGLLPRFRSFWCGFS
ncbi:YihY/virulence factor BrkB family protein, partial [Desulfobulbus sp. US1]|nr:YihY/virulence factor BrkB family protein [Desulfobulbus sp. US1]